MAIARWDTGVAEGRSAAASDPVGYSTCAPWTARIQWTHLHNLSGEGRARDERVATLCAEALGQHPRFRAAYDFLLLREQAGELPAGLGDWWTRYQDADEDQREAMVQALGPNQGASGGGKRRRRRRKPANSQG